MRRLLEMFTQVCLRCLSVSRGAGKVVVYSLGGIIPLYPHHHTPALAGECHGESKGGAASSFLPRGTET